MKHLIQTLTFLFVLLTFACSLAESDDVMLFDFLIEEYNRFISDGQTQQIPIYDNGTDNVYSIVFCNPEQVTGKLFNNSITIHSDQSRDYAWDAYEAGERAVSYLYELYHYSMAFEQSGHPVPVDTQAMDQLFAEHQNSMTINGMDSAYACGEVTANDGVPMLWDAYPFTVQGGNGDVYQTAAYICFELVRKEKDFDGIYRFVVADQKAVCRLFEHMLNLLPDINQQDRELMLLFVEYNRKLEVEAEDTGKRAFGRILEAYKEMKVSAYAVDLSYRDAGPNEPNRFYLELAKESNAAFNSFARERTVGGAAFDNWSMDALVHDLLNTTDKAVRVTLGLREGGVVFRAATDSVVDIICNSGLDLIRYGDWYFCGQDADASFRWEIIPFSLQVPCDEEPGFTLTRPNLYVRMLTLQENGKALCEEWVIEDEQFIRELLPGCMEDLDAQVSAVTRSWNDPKEDASAETTQL